MCLQICRKHKLSEPTAYLLEKAGDIQGAFGIILEVNHSTLCILMDFPKQINTIRMGLSIMHFKGT